MKSKRLLTGLSLAILAGCATQSPAPAVCPEPPPVGLPTRPSLAIQTLPKGATQDELLRAYVASLYQCVGYTEELRTLVKPAKP